MDVLTAHGLGWWVVFVVCTMSFGLGVTYHLQLSFVTVCRLFLPGLLCFVVSVLVTLMPSGDPVSMHSPLPQHIFDSVASWNLWFGLWSMIAFGPPCLLLLAMGHRVSFRGTEQ